MMKRFILSLFILLPALCFAQTERTTLGVFAMRLTVTSTDIETAKKVYKETGQYPVKYYDDHSVFLVASLVMGSDTLRVESDFPGHLEFGEVKPGKVELIIEKRPNSGPFNIEPYSETFAILPGDNIVFAQLKIQGENPDPRLHNMHVSSEDIYKHPIPVRIEEDGLHYDVMTMLFNLNNLMENETYNRLKSFPGVRILPRELILSGDETKYYRVNDNTLVLNYLKK